MTWYNYNNLDLIMINKERSPLLSQYVTNVVILKEGEIDQYHVIYSQNKGRNITITEYVLSTY